MIFPVYTVIFRKRTQSTFYVMMPSLNFAYGFVVTTNSVSN